MIVACIIQARMGSTRLPGKVLLPLVGKPMLHHVIDRVADCKTVTNIVIATTTKDRDDEIIKAVEGYNAKTSTFRGSEDDVLDRYYQAAKAVNADIVIRVTSDCPLIDPEIIDEVVQKLLDDPTLDYSSNVLGKLTFPRGLDVQAIRMSTLEKIWNITTEPEDREHVTIYLRKHPEGFKTDKITLNPPHSDYRWTVDEEDDFKLVKEIYSRLYPTKPKFRMNDILKLMEEHPELPEINRHVHQKLSQF